jgi:hypothetical protein
MLQEYNFMPILLDEGERILSHPRVPFMAAELSRTAPRNRTGESFEEIFAKVIPNSIRLPKDKKWFDIKLNNDGIECKTYLFSEILPDAWVDNVLKRVSQVEARVGNKLKDPSKVGRELINYLHTTIAEHATEKGITGRKIMAILARGKDGIHFAYWEELLYFGDSTDYSWSWNGKNTLVGDKNGEHIFSWYQNQKQLFYRWKIPSDAIFFEAEPYKNIEISQSEYFELIKKSYIEGYDDGTHRRPPKYKF